MTTKTYEIKCRNNADSVRIGSGLIRIPGVTSHRHLGGKNARVESIDTKATEQWLDEAFEVKSYESHE